MLHRRTFLTSLGCLVAFPSLSRAGVLDKIKERRNERLAWQKPVTLNYGSALLDIYAPKEAKNLPVYMHVHGGGWKIGSRKNVQSKPKWFLNNGIIFVSIDYRLLPQFEVAVQANDVEAAYAYVRKNIAKFGGDPSRIVVSGHSAGCHLTALTGLRGGLPGVKALVLNDVDVYDIQAIANDPASRGVNLVAFPDKEQWKALSPATYVGTRAHPPILIAYSRNKNLQKASIAFANKLRAAGTKVELFDGSAYSHVSINRSFGQEEGGFTAATLKFLTDVMKL